MPNDTNAPTKAPVKALSDLSTDIADIVRGYEVMQEKADDDLRPIAQRLHALHEGHAAALLTAIDRMGGHPENTGSMMGAVHAAVATGRDWFGALDASAIPQIIDGEERLIESYDTALAQVTGIADVEDQVAEQRATVQAQIDALRNA